jgi:hypothetical protein
MALHKPRRAPVVLSEEEMARLLEAGRKSCPESEDPRQNHAAQWKARSVSTR